MATSTRFQQTTVSFDREHRGRMALNKIVECPRGERKLKGVRAPIGISVIDFSLEIHRCPISEFFHLIHAEKLFAVDYSRDLS